MQPLDQLHRGTRGPGGSTFLLPPGGFAPLSTRESGLTAANESNIQKNTNKLVKFKFAGGQKRPAAPCKPPGPARATGRRIHYSGNQKLMLP